MGVKSYLSLVHEDVGARLRMYWPPVGSLPKPAGLRDREAPARSLEGFLQRAGFQLEVLALMSFSFAWRP